MPRFEHAGKFWSAELAGKKLTTQFGKLYRRAAIGE